jgi:hypothetical protein
MNEANLKFLMLAALDLSLIAILVFAALPAFLVPEDELWQPEKIVLLPQVPQQCSAGQEIACATEKNCPGVRTCVQGEWSACIVRKICTPGAQAACFVDACAMGYKTCNPCGTGYGDCSGQ